MHCAGCTGYLLLDMFVAPVGAVGEQSVVGAVLAVSLRYDAWAWCLLYKPGLADDCWLARHRRIPRAFINIGQKHLIWPEIESFTSALNSSNDCFI